MERGKEFPGGLVAKDSALSLQWLGLNSWPGNFHMPWAQTKRRKKKLKNKEGGNPGVVALVAGALARQDPVLQPEKSPPKPPHNSLHIYVAA